MDWEVIGTFRVGKGPCQRFNGIRDSSDCRDGKEKADVETDSTSSGDCLDMKGEEEEGSPNHSKVSNYTTNKNRKCRKE